MYTPCADCERDNSIFHWRTVACSVECGIEFFKQVEEARNPKHHKEEVKTEEVVTVVDEIHTEQQESTKKKKTRRKNSEESE
jgi:hypothetical protein